MLRDGAATQLHPPYALVLGCMAALAAGPPDAAIAG